jgi:threonine dehydrogenase-like Zn-dependent dehydrogenase
MRALCWMGVNDLQVNTVPDPRIVNPHDVVLKVRLTTTCGSDLYLIDGYIPTMREGDVIGHEYMGEIADVGPEATKFKVGAQLVLAVPARAAAQESRACRDRRTASRHPCAIESSLSAVWDRSLQRGVGARGTRAMAR